VLDRMAVDRADAGGGGNWLCVRTHQRID
jgi:hypothetical protein